MKKTCQICGKNSGYLPLCYACFDLRDKGEVEKCSKCGTWYKIIDGCPNCGNEKNEKCTKCGAINCHIGPSGLCDSCYYGATKQNDPIEKCAKCGKVFCYIGPSGLCDDCYYGTAQQDEIKKEQVTTKRKDPNTKVNTCKLCNKPSGEFDICYNCYRKQIEEDLKRDKETLIESEKDSGIDIRKKWEAKIRTQNGQYVRSHAECRIADWLARNEITYEYERIVFSKKDKDKFLLSDFYLPRARIYIEFWGYKDKETYNKRRDEKKNIYDENKLTMLDLTSNELENLDDNLRKILCDYYEFQ